MENLFRLLYVISLSLLVAIFLISRWEMSFSSHIRLGAVKDRNLHRNSLHGDPNQNAVLNPSEGLGGLGIRLLMSSSRNRISRLLDEVNKFTRMFKNKVVGVKKNLRETAIAVVVLTCNRETVGHSLQRLLSVRPSAERFPVIVSQDCQNETTAEIVKGFGDRVLYLQQEREKVTAPPAEKRYEGYFKIARHYVKALNKTFFDFGYKYAIIVEDDLYVSNDFFEYFLATLPILEADPTLFCVSAWNDNGRTSLIDVDAPQLLHRTDFFPGLGWMLTKATWSELAWKWPAGYWDDWLRQPEQRKGRACIRPEISRTKHFGNIGVSKSDIQYKELKHIMLNDKFVSFTNLDLSYLLQSRYDKRFLKSVFWSQIVSWNELKSAKPFSRGSERAMFCNEILFPKVAKSFNLMQDLRSGVPRTAYMGVVSFFYKNARIYLIIITDGRYVHSTDGIFLPGSTQPYNILETM